MVVLDRGMGLVRLGLVTWVGVVLGLGVADVVGVFEWVFLPFCRLVVGLDLIGWGLGWVGVVCEMVGGAMGLIRG